MDYKKIHDSIIGRAKSRLLVGYKERHHILPKSMGGDNSKGNLVDLTAKEHYIIHRLLIKIYPNERKLVYAFWRMINDRKEQRYKASPKIYEQTRILAAKDLRDRFNNASPESEKRRREGISKNNKKPKSKEHVKNIVEAKLGNKNPMFGKVGKDHPTSKAIDQYDLDGNFIKTWESMNQAEIAFNFKPRSLWATVRTVGKKKGGFKWKYK